MLAHDTLLDPRSPTGHLVRQSVSGALTQQLARLQAMNDLSEQTANFVNSAQGTLRRLTGLNPRAIDALLSVSMVQLPASLQAAATSSPALNLLQTGTTTPAQPTTGFSAQIILQGYVLRLVQRGTDLRGTEPRGFATEAYLLIESPDGPVGRPVEHRNELAELLMTSALCVQPPALGSVRLSDLLIVVQSSSEPSQGQPTPPAMPPVALSQQLGETLFLQITNSRGVPVLIPIDLASGRVRASLGSRAGSGPLRAQFSGEEAVRAHLARELELTVASAAPSTGGEEGVHRLPAAAQLAALQKSYDHGVSLAEA